MRSNVQSSHVQSPASSDSVTSQRHSAQCDAGRNSEVIEACPPRSTQPESSRSQQQMVETEVFPLVSAAHEFKTPLVVMLGYAELLLSGRLGSLNDRQREVLVEIQQSAERLQKLIHDLLLLCELRGAPAVYNGRLDSESAAVNDHVREIFDYWAAAAKQKWIAYQFFPAPNDPRVRVQPLKLQQIVSSLIENALKFSPEGSEVAVRVTPCFWERREAQSEFLFNLDRKTSLKVENAVRIDVTDTGPGIPSHHHEDIFWDFVQLPGGASRGTGLGLAIARRLTAAHGGALWVESEPPKGSRFSLLLAQTGWETRG